MVYIITIWLVWWILSFLKPIYIRWDKLPAVAMVVAPIIFINKKALYKYYLTDEGIESVYRHEYRHIIQQRILSPLIFLVLYGIFYVVLLYYYFCVVGKGFKEAHFNAYWNIPFEKDARKYSGQGW